MYLMRQNLKMHRNFEIPLYFIIKFSKNMIKFYMEKPFITDFGLSSLCLCVF